LRKLGKRVAEQQLLLDQVRLQLPPDLAAHCQAAVRNPGRLAVYADSPAWASRLRYLVPELAERFGIPTGHIQVRVLAPPLRRHGDTPERKIKRLSERNRRMLIEVAEGCSDLELKAALRRLAGAEA
jgi:hypothetical protein